MKLTYYVEDGYISASRPQHITIDDGDIEACETEEEYNELIEDAVQEHFNQNISFSYTPPPFKKTKQ